MSTLVQFDIQETIRESWRKRGIEAELNKLHPDIEIVKFFIKYTAFNSAFAGAVACLAGNIHFQTELFSKSSVMGYCEDYSSEIASRVFYAAEDEYSALRGSKRITHRRIAQSFVNALLLYIGIDNVSQLLSASKSSQIKEYRKRTLSGYKTQGFSENKDVFEAIAFHIASETFADLEFNTISEHLKIKHPALVKTLQQSPSSCGVNQYYWIEVHTGVEAAHGEMALEALRLATVYNTDNVIDISMAVKNGIESFATLQEDFFKWAIIP
jgi:hypothetical protein